MKTLLVSLNSKYTHSSLAPWYLKSCCSKDCGEVRVLELTINDSPDNLLGAIYSEKPDILAFSCYIWNISLVSKLAGDMAKLCPDLPIILGGPEVSYESKEFLAENTDVDYIIAGEGEFSFSMLLQVLMNRQLTCQNFGRRDEPYGSAAEANCRGTGIPGLEGIPGLVYRSGDNIMSNPMAFIEKLDSIPSPYTDEMLSSLGDRTAYFESSRGCPFSCSYCLSSESGKVRYFSLDRVRKDLRTLVLAGVRQVKFVDRTFNCNRERALDIFRSIIGMATDEETASRMNKVGLNFHFEAAADLFDEEMLNVLESSPAGLIQLEIGVQSFNGNTLEAVKRKTDLARVSENVIRLLAMGNMHIHLDLIAGLPYEDITSFRASFDSVYKLKPHKLQLGFLKLLKGTGLRRDANKHDYRFRNYPPYEILKNAYLSYDDILLLKDLEELVERYYNSGRFSNTLRYLEKTYFSSAFDFYHNFGSFLKLQGRAHLPTALRDMYKVLYEFAETFSGTQGLAAAGELLKLDFLASDSSGALPPVLERYIPDGFRDNCFEFLKNEAWLKQHLPAFEGVPAKQIFKHVHFECFKSHISRNMPDFFLSGITVILFNYTQKDPVTGLYEYTPVEFPI